MQFSISSLLIFTYVLVMSFAGGAFGVSSHLSLTEHQRPEEYLWLVLALGMFPGVLVWFVSVLHDIDTEGKRRRACQIFQLIVPPLVAFVVAWLGVAAMSV